MVRGILHDERVNTWLEGYYMVRGLLPGERVITR